MVAPALEVEGGSIVLIGAFNPAIVRPSWVARMGLIADTELVAEKPSVVTPEVSQFSTEVLDVQVLMRQMTASTARASQALVRDFVVGLLTQLPHTPVARMGINREAHFRMPDEESWHRLGEAIVPRRNWSFLEQAGLRSAVIEGRRPDSRPGHIWMRVEPSLSVPLGVFIQQNDHFELGGDGTGEDVAALISEVWDESQERARGAFEKILSLAS